MSLFLIVALVALAVSEVAILVALFCVLRWLRIEQSGYRLPPLKTTGQVLGQLIQDLKGYRLLG